MTYVVELEFEGEKPMPKELAGYDCRICMALQRSRQDESEYIMRTKKDERLDENQRMVDYHDILTGEATICLPDHAYAHADHDAVERCLYGEYLEARLPADEYRKLQVNAWKARQLTEFMA
jgi:hypothetical protein